MKGNGALALRASAARRRTKAEVREAKLQEAARAAEIELKLQQLEELQKLHKQDETQLHNANQMINMLIDQGLIKTFPEVPGQV